VVAVKVHAEFFGTYSLFQLLYWFADHSSEKHLVEHLYRKSLQPLAKTYFTKPLQSHRGLIEQHGAFELPAEAREPGRAREQVLLQFQTSDDARRARARGACALRVAGPRRDRIPALGMSLAGVSRLS
jgi:hypothetical protein